MKFSLMGGLFDLLARLPLSALHWLGAMLGWATYTLSGRYAARLRENLRKSGLSRSDAEFQELLHTNIREAGKGIMELPWIWRRPFEEVIGSVAECHGWEHLEQAHAQGRGIIVLTPHLGCFEIISLYVSARYPVTSMYRPPRQKSLDSLMHEGRARGQMKLVAADMSGVRQLLKALRRGEIIGILPDQAPGNGEGEWAPFFGRPAYTMTLIGRLMEVSKAPVVICHGERLPQGSGYALHFSPLNLDTAYSIPRQMNAALEEVIRSCPAQYLWSYNRYKVPRGALPPDALKEPQC